MEDQNYTRKGKMRGNFALDAQYGIASMVQFFGENIMFPFNLTPREGRENRKSIIALLENYLKQNRISHCQKICLLKCAASNITEYQYNSVSKFGSVQSAYRTQEGVCTEFSKIFDDLAYQFDISSNTAGDWTATHAFNRVKIGHKLVAIEPQSDECIFYSNEPRKEFIGADVHGNFNTNNEKTNQLHYMPIDNTKLVKPKMVLLR